MRLGIATAARIDPTRPSRPLPDVYGQVVDEAVLAEELGFDSWRLGEHHFSDDQHNPSVFPLLAAVAARTERIQLGPFVLLLALHDPLRVAEDAATVDVLSGGRLELGVGARPMAAECAGFGVAPEDAFARTYEALEVLARAFTGDPFSHRGRHFAYADVRVTPAPMQPGGPPILMAAMGPQSLARAGRRGYHLASALHSPLVARYEEAQREAGRTRDDYRLVSAPVFLHVAATRQAAWDQAEAALHWFASFYLRRGVPATNMPLPAIGELRARPDFTLFGQPFVVGTPDDVNDALTRHRDADLDELTLAFNHAGMERAHVRDAMTLFARELAPELRGWGRRAD